jgi:tetratricopeptide (TPR) repeat protein
MVSWGHSCGILGAVAALIPGAAWAGSADGQQPAAPKKELTLEDRGDIFMARKMFREAIETYLKTEPLTAVVLNKTGIAYQQQNELELAKKFYGRATKTDPNYAEAINNQGTVYYAQKSFSRAIRQYKRALRLRPRSASILSNLGTAWFARRNYKQAFETYQQALAIDPDVFERHGNQGVLLEERDIEERAKFNYYMARLYAKRHERTGAAVHPQGAGRRLQGQEEIPRGGGLHGFAEAAGIRRADETGAACSLGCA